MDEACGRSGAPIGIYTETLAQLYLQQGFLEAAVAIYRHLVTVHPERDDLRTTLAHLQAQHEAVSSPSQPSHATPGNKSDIPFPHEGDARQRLIAHLERWLQHIRQQRLGQQSSWESGKKRES